MTYGDLAYGTGPYGAPAAVPTSAFPTTNVYVSFTDPFGSLTWTDVSKYVTGFKTTSGRQHELQQINPSTATITLYNSPVNSTDGGGRFSPWNTGGPYYRSVGWIACPVKITATWLGVTYPVFYGYAQSWTPANSGDRTTVTLVAKDLLALLNLSTLDINAYSIYPTANATAYYTLADAIGQPSAADSTGHGYTGSVFGTVSFGQASPFLTGPATAATVTGNSGINIPASISGTAVSVDGWIKCPVAGVSGGFIIATGNGVSTGISLYVSSVSGYATGSVNGTSFSGSVNLNDGNWHYLALAYNAGAAVLYVDGAQAGIMSPAGPLAALSGTIATGNVGVDGFAQIALYNTTLSPTTIANQYTYGMAAWAAQDSGSRIQSILSTLGLSGFSSVGTGVTTVQGATSSLSSTTAAAYINTIAASEPGICYQDNAGMIQFRNRDYQFVNPSSQTSQALFTYHLGTGYQYHQEGIVPVQDDLDVWNNVPVQRQGGIRQTVADATSQSHYGRRTLTGKTSLLMADDGTALGLGQYLLGQYKTPQTRVRSLTVDNTINSGAAMAQMLGRKLLDRITVEWKPLDGSSVDFNQPSLIEAVNHSVDAATRTWTTQFAVTPIGTTIPFILDSATYGVLSTNQLGF